MTRPTETAQTLDRGLRLLHLVADAPGETVAVDTPADLVKAEKLLKKKLDSGH